MTITDLVFALALVIFIVTVLWALSGGKQDSGPFTPIDQ